MVGDCGGCGLGSGHGTAVKSFSLSLLPVRSSKGIIFGSVITWCRSSSGSAAESGILKYKNDENYKFPVIENLIIMMYFAQAFISAMIL